MSRITVSGFQLWEKFCQKVTTIIRDTDLLFFAKGQKLVILFLALALMITMGPVQAEADTAIDGQLRKWHKITLTFDGPESDEEASPNPFTYYRLNVTFSNGSTTYVVPGYFAADGNAANSGTTSGNKWRVHFAPDKTGTWNYQVSFRQGTNVAVSSNANAGSKVSSLDGETGSFVVQDTNKSGRDFRGKGMLRYVGGHYLQFAETGEYFLKQGADAPENFLAYDDFDNTPNNGGRRKSWGPHVQDWNSGDPTWNGGKGKGIIGALNYLASEGMNAFSFIPMNIGGDDKNVFPYISDDSSDRTRMDCSKLDQWEKLFEHADKKGLFLHFKTQETENELLLDNGNLGNERKLYYRELIARYGHHLALNWNLGEEINNASISQKVSWAQYFQDNDPYGHHIVIHNGSNHYEMLGDASQLTGFSLQTNKSDFSNVHGRVKDYLDRSASAGKPWAVACDEPGDASHALRPDDDAGNSHEDGRKNGLWGTFMAGGWGNEWYFGYQHDHSDLTCEDFRSRDNWWDYSRYALEFFDKSGVPYWEMTNDNSLTSASDDYCFYKKGVAYVVYLKNGGSTTLNLNGVSGSFNVSWYDPRNGGNFKSGSVDAVNGGGNVSLGNAPNNTGKDWVILVTLNDSFNAPPTAKAGADQTVIDTDGDSFETIALDGSGSTDTDGTIVSYEWTEEGSILSTSSNAELYLAVGTHIITLTVIDNEGAQDSDSVKVTIKEESSLENAVVSMTLVDADNDSDIAVLKDGDTLNLAALPTRNLSVRADTQPYQVNTVQFSLSGATTRSQKESHLPYALWGDASGDYYPGTFNTGEHTLVATPTLNGEVGSALTIDFDVIDEVEPENHVPTVIDDTYTMEANDSLEVAAPGILANDSDVDGDPLKAFLISEPANGQLYFEIDGSFTYVPDYGFVGTDTFTYLASDSIADSPAATVSITVTSGTSGSGSVESFTLIDADSDLDIMTLEHGATINLSDLDTSDLNIRANTYDEAGEIERVTFVLEGAIAYSHSERVEPYALWGNKGPDYAAGSLSPGDYILTATPYLNGFAGPPTTISFTVVEEVSWLAAVTGYTLVNANTNVDIMALENGANLQLSKLPSNINIRAEVEAGTESVSKVVLKLTGTTTTARVEKVTPYALWGDKNSNYYNGSLNPGNHTLVATPYVDGIAEKALTISFEVID